MRVARGVWVLYLIGMVLAVANSGVQANDDDQGLVFRVDTRPPEVIYGPSSPPGGSRARYGFRPRGNNADLLAYARGETCGTKGDGTAAYISTTDNGTWAANYAYRLSMLHETRSVYVYVIDRTPAFSNMASLLRGQRGATAGAIDNAVDQGEWITRQPIPVETIRGHRVYNANEFPRDRDGLNFDTRPAPVLIANPYHVERRLPVDPPPRAVVMPAPEGAPYRYVYLRVSEHPPVGPCLAATLPCRENSSSTSGDASASCSYVERPRPRVSSLPSALMYLAEPGPSTSIRTVGEFKP
jgi:hypothetical protein